MIIIDIANSWVLDHKYQLKLFNYFTIPEI